jgi:hypothetical protein
MLMINRSLTIVRSRRASVGRVVQRILVAPPGVDLGGEGSGGQLTHS